MTKAQKKLRAIDLYSGVGGWSVGLRLAGIEVVSSYDLSGDANETNFKNNGHPAQTVDIRGLALSELPKNIDVVVGSPPCTEFSFANRGGGGDIANGLKDIVKFLTIVEYLKPKAWAMENVPRLAEILARELKGRGKLAAFRHLNMQVSLVDMSHYGVPQRRLRCIAGSIHSDLLMSYTVGLKQVTLGTVLTALNQKTVRDPLYGLILPRKKVTDHVPEEFLNAEEIRINKAGKTLHPVYNAMSFPDRIDRPVRTITATCTRVSRESVVIDSPNEHGKVRRLTIRERACLQGFPVSFQFYANSYTQKAKMVGNAIPPAFAYFVAHALKRTPVNSVPALTGLARKLKLPEPLATNSVPPRSSKSFPLGRTFRFSIPSLHLKSGVRFEFGNQSAVWAIRFYFGNSKSIHELSLGANMTQMVAAHIPAGVRKVVLKELERLQLYIGRADVAHMQRIWAHKGVGLTSPFMLLDRLDESGRTIKQLLCKYEHEAKVCVGEVLVEQYQESASDLQGLHKLARNAVTVWAGLLVGSWANLALGIAMGSTIAARLAPPSARAA